MATKISAAELSQNLPDILSRVHDRGEEFVIEQHGEAIATLRPAPPMPATLRTLADIVAKYHDEGDSFADDLEAIQRSQPMMPPKAWPD